MSDTELHLWKYTIILSKMNIPPKNDVKNFFMGAFTDIFVGVFGGLLMCLSGCAHEDLKT